GVLRKINIFCVRSQSQYERFVFLGAPPERVKVSGNMKYCNSTEEEKIGDEREVRKKFAIKDDDLIFTAGSTHNGEEEIIVEVFRRLRQDFANLRLIIAPRYIERADDIKRLAGELPVTVIDKFGILKELYSISDIVFVGGSLVRHGGHNIIEPAIFGKPVLFGPHMFNFRDVAEEFLKGGGAVLVRDKNDLEITCKRLLTNKGERWRLGENARLVVLRNKGAAENCFIELKQVLGDA
ncbi:MAG: hypothetical protein NC828_06415, partial [Candidatus Omnitrophica bacterium]|nr:hypothetical protein [Candidatus Omnitrophota bacterium]